MQIDTSTFLTKYSAQFQMAAGHFENPKPVKSEVEPVVEAAQSESGELVKLKQILAEDNITLKFSRDDKTKSIVVELVDDRTGESIRQIPSTVSLKLAAHFVTMQGHFVDEIE